MSKLQEMYKDLEKTGVSRDELRDFMFACRTLNRLQDELMGVSDYDNPVPIELET